MVLYNGKEAWRAAREVADLIEEVPQGLGAYRPRLRYLLLDEGRLAPAQVAEQSNLAAVLFRLERGRRLEEVQEGVEALGALLGREEDRELRRSFGAWLTQVLLPARMPEGKEVRGRNLTEVRTMLRETVAEWTRQWREEGWQEGRKEGRREGEAALLLRLLERRFGVLAPEIRRRIESADDEHLLQWGEQVLTAATVEEVFRPRA